MEDSSERKNNQMYNRSKQLLFILILIAPLVYFLILIVLHVKYLDEIIIPESIFNDSLFNALLVVFIISSIIEIIITYKIFIPFAMWEEDIARRFSRSFMFLTLGGSAISIYGLILGVIWWADYNFVPFYIAIPFIAVGMIHGLYLYYRYILNYDARKKEMDEKYLITGKSSMISEPLDPTLEIFTPIINYLNTNEKIMLNYTPKIGRILLLGLIAIVSAAFISFFMFYALYAFNTGNEFRLTFLTLFCFGIGIFSLTILPILLIVRVIGLKRTMYVFTSVKIILKYPRKIKIIGYDEIISFKKFHEGLTSREIKIVFKNKSVMGSNKEEEIYIDVPRELHLLENLKTLINEFSKRD